MLITVASSDTPGLWSPVCHIAGNLINLGFIITVANASLNNHNFWHDHFLVIFERMQRSFCSRALFLYC